MQSFSKVRYTGSYGVLQDDYTGCVVILTRFGVRELDGFAAQGLNWGVMLEVWGSRV